MRRGKIFSAIVLSILSFADSIRFSTHSSASANSDDQRLSLNSDRSRRYEEFQKRSTHLEPANSRKSDTFLNDLLKESNFLSNNQGNCSQALSPTSHVSDQLDTRRPQQKPVSEQTALNYSTKDGGRRLEEASRNVSSVSGLSKVKSVKARSSDTCKNSSLPKERRNYFSFNFISYMSTIAAYLQVFWNSMCNLQALEFCARRIPDAAKKFVPSTPTRWVLSSLSPSAVLTHAGSHGMKTLVSESAAIWSQAFWKLLVMKYAMSTNEMEMMMMMMEIMQYVIVSELFMRTTTMKLVMAIMKEIDIVNLAMKLMRTMMDLST
eukprot:760226-Hanusia_phi.AAC.9